MWSLIQDFGEIIKDKSVEWNGYIKVCCFEWVNRIREFMVNQIIRYLRYYEINNSFISII